MILQGLGFFISNLSKCEDGEPISILAAAQAASLSRIFIKIADGINSCNLPISGINSTALLVQTVKTAGISVWGWQNIHEIDPTAEAALAIKHLQSLDLDGYVINPDLEYQHAGSDIIAGQFMTAIHASLSIPIALRSFGFPHYHPELPWSTFLEFCDLHMPEVYWEQTINPGQQLTESKRQCDSLPNARPFIPTVASGFISNWSPLDKEFNDFLTTAREIDLHAINFFDWDNCQAGLPVITIPDTLPDTSPPNPDSTLSSLPTTEATANSQPDDFMAAFLAGLNQRQVEQVIAFYDQDAVQVWAETIRCGTAAIRNNLSGFLASLAPGAVISLAQVCIEGDQRKFTWHAGAFSAETSLVLKKRKIILEYTLPIFS